jgi:hypothetical protein
MNIDDEKSEINDEIILSFGKKIINLFDFPIVVFEKFDKELKYIYYNISLIISFGSSLK